ncbi:MAG: MerC domain-containing protein [Phycisphaerae bacterium]|nr:MerC domain-containing protein [Phycisphaerae bacterium]MDW8263081.1 MerC domain-containing protein [Phycisphaerales bacterium]
MGVNLASPMPKQVPSAAPTPARRDSSAVDAAGVAVSLACGIHCILTPVLLLMLPTLGEAFHSPIVHRVLAVVVTAVASFALYRGYRRHGHWLPITMGSAGGILVWTAVFLPHAAADHEQFQLPLGSILTMIGSALLISSHVINLRNCRSGCCHRHDST